MQYAIQIRATEYLKGNAEFDWVGAADLPADGLNIPATGWTNSIGDVNDVSGALESLIEDISVGSTTMWKVTTDGGIRAVSFPQQGQEPADGDVPETANSWFLNLCCLQGTLGQIATQIYLFPDLSPFRKILFPRMQREAYTASSDNLGAWQIELNPGEALPSYTRQEALALRLRIINQLDSWTLVLMRRDNPTATPERVWPTDVELDNSVGQIVRPQLSSLPLSIYPPSGEKCNNERRRPVGAFPPGACAPPEGGRSDCYFPIRNYPSCCFSRTNFPLLRTY